MRTSSRFAPLLLSGAIAAALFAGTLAAQGADRKPAERKISVSGTAVTRAVPDVIVWRLTTTDQHQNLLEAKQASDAKLRALLGLREELGIEAKDIQTGYLNIRREYERSRHGNVRTFKQFAVTRHVTVKQRDVKRFDEFLTKFVSAAEVEVNFTLESSRITDLRMQTRLDAVRIARTKAQAMAKSLDTELGPVLEILETPSVSSRWSGVNYANTFNTAVNANGAAPADAESGTFAPGAIEVRVGVRVTFALE